MIYFIQMMSGPIKIGYTKSIRSRMKNLKRECNESISLLGTMPGGFNKEKELHDKFASHRMNGEWFVPAQMILDFIQQNRVPVEEDETTKLDHLFPSVKQQIANLGENITLARKRRRLTQSDLAKLVGVSLPTLIGAEKGAPTVSIGVYVSILFHLGLSNDIVQVGKNDTIGFKLQDSELGRRVRHRIDKSS